jgi:hypothetical protein
MLCPSKLGEYVLHTLLLVLLLIPALVWAELQTVKPISVQVDCSTWTDTQRLCRETAGGLFEYDGTTLNIVGAGSSPSSWNTVMGVGNVYSSADDTASAATVTRDAGTACSTEAGWRQYISAANIPTLEACDAAGNLITQDFAVYASQNFSITIDNGASTQVSCYDVGDDGVITIADTEGCGHFRRPLRDITVAIYTMVQRDCGNIIYNADADALEIDLIADPTGCLVCAYQAAAGAITFDPNGTDTITLSGTAASAGEAVILASGIDNNVCLHGTSTTNWRVLLGTGAVTEETP